MAATHTQRVFVNEKDEIVAPEQGTKCYENTYDESGKLIAQKIFFAK